MINPATILWSLALALSLFLLITKWVDTSRVGANLSLSFLTLMYTCLLSNSLSASDDLNTAAAALGLASLIVWSVQKLSEGVTHVNHSRL